MEVQVLQSISSQVQRSIHVAVEVTLFFMNLVLAGVMKEEAATQRHCVLHWYSTIHMLQLMDAIGVHLFNKHELSQVSNLRFF
jgi:hypothetical protein